MKSTRLVPEGDYPRPLCRGKLIHSRRHGRSCGSVADRSRPSIGIHMSDLTPTSAKGEAAMAFTIELGFATEHDRDDFVERILPKLHGRQADVASAEEE